MRKLIILRIVLLFMFLGSVYAAYANSNDNSIISPIVRNKYRNTRYGQDRFDENTYHALPKVLQSQTASMWHLTTEEYQRYLFYMNHSPEGVRYRDRNLDPNIIMAMESQSPDKFKKYIRNAVLDEHTALVKLLRVNAAFSRMAKEMYRNEKPIEWHPVQKTFDVMNYHLPLNGDKLYLFIRVKSPRIRQEAIQHLLKTIHTQTTTQLNIYDVSNTSKKAIIQFAEREDITPADVQQSKITLNHGEQFMVLLEKSAQLKISAPTLIILRSGQYIRGRIQ